MRIYRGRAFTYPEKIEGYEVIGNPATVCICDKELPTEKEMSEFAIGEKAPIITFIAPQKIPDEFNIRFYNPDGTKVCICGHGLIFSSHILSKVFNCNKILFNYDYSLSKEKIFNSKIEAVIENDLVTLKLPSFKPQKVEGYNSDLEWLLTNIGLEKQDVSEIFKCNALRDYIVRLKDVEKLRSLKPNFNGMIEYCNNLNLRCAFITSESKLENFDYETRAFIPHSDIDEDIVCGSSNCSLSNLWNSILGKANMNCLFPYMSYDGIYGGVQSVGLEYNSLNLSGYATTE